MCRTIRHLWNHPELQKQRYESSLLFSGSLDAWGGGEREREKGVIPKSSELLVHYLLQRTCTPSAILTLEEIQSVVDLANERTKETIEGKCVIVSHGN